MIKLTEAEPIGEKTGLAHLNTGPDSSKHRWEQRTHPIYDDRVGRVFRTARVRKMIILRDAGNLVGLSPAQISGLEFGRYTCSAEDWRSIWLAVIGEEPWDPSSLCGTCEGSGRVEGGNRFHGFGMVTCSTCNGVGRSFQTEPEPLSVPTSIAVARGEPICCGAVVSRLAAEIARAVCPGCGQPFTFGPVARPRT